MLLLTTHTAWAPRVVSHLDICVSLSFNLIYKIMIILGPHRAGVEDSVSKINVQCSEQHVGLVGTQYLLGIRILPIMLAFQ